MIESVEYGEIIYNGERFKDVKIINQQPHEWIWKKDHTITLADVKDMLEEVDVIVLGTGQEGLVAVEKEVINACEKKHIHVHIEQTPTAVRLYNELEGHHIIGAIIHSTC